MNKNIQTIKMKSLGVLSLILAPISVLLAGTVVDEESKIPYKTAPEFQNIDIPFVIMMFLLCVLIAVLIVYAVNRLGFGKQRTINKKRIDILEVKKLSTKQSVSLIEVDHIQYLIVSTDSGCHVVKHNESAMLKDKLHDVN